VVNQKLIAVAQSVHWTQSGFSVDLDGLEPPQWPGWYMVSLAGCERRFYCHPVVEFLLYFIEDNIDELGRRGRYIGGWIDGENYYLDISVIVVGLDCAMTLAKANSQKAVYDLWARTSICTKGVVSSYKLPKWNKKRLLYSSGIQELVPKSYLGGAAEYPCGYWPRPSIQETRRLFRPRLPEILDNERRTTDTPNVLPKQVTQRHGNGQSLYERRTDQTDTEKIGIISPSFLEGRRSRSSANNGIIALPVPSCRTLKGGCYGKR